MFHLQFEYSQLSKMVGLQVQDNYNELEQEHVHTSIKHN